VALVILAAIAIQSYVRRGLQGRYADVADNTTARVSATLRQYDPYYTDIEEGSAGQGVVESRDINMNFQPGGRFRTDINQDTRNTPRRTNVEGINSYGD